MSKKSLYTLMLHTASARQARACAAEFVHLSSYHANSASAGHLPIRAKYGGSKRVESEGEYGTN